MQWYYAHNGQRQGPVSPSDFERLVLEGVIKPDTLVWHQGMANWVAYSTVGAAAAAPVGTPGVGDDTEVCVVSGKRYPRREMIQYEGKWISAEKRDEFFQRLREGVAIPGSGSVPGPFGYGGFWRRFLAKLVDGLITGAIGIPLNMLLAATLLGTANYFTMNGQQPDLVRVLLFQAISMTLGIIIGVAYTWFFIVRFDATPGKMALGLKLLRPDGSKLSTGRIIGRYFAEMVSAIALCIGYIIAAFDDEKRGLHDRICDTRVIKTR